MRVLLSHIVGASLVSADRLQLHRDQKCVTIPERDCDFYVDCLEKHIPCGDNGYALGFGDRLCHRFGDAARKAGEDS